MEPDGPRLAQASPTSNRESEGMPLGIEFFAAAPEATVTPAVPRIDASWAKMLRETVGLLGQVPEADIGGPIQAVARRLGAESALVGELSTSERGATIIAAIGVEALSALRLEEVVRALSDCGARLPPGESFPSLFSSSDGIGVAIGLSAQLNLPLMFALFVGRGLVEPGEAGRAELSLFMELLSCFRPGSAALTSRSACRRAAGLVMPAGSIRLQSAPMRRLYGELAAIAPSDLSVFLTGETGVGKEHLAHALHLSSRRATGPFVAVNCAALPADLIEAELFGIARGVATGVAARAGRFLEAHGGTLFLDEVSELSLSLQPKLLRALQEKKVDRLGGPSVSVDVRVLAASNVTTVDLLRGDRLRPDLYYRLAGCRVTVPPLRARVEDIPTLVRHIVFDASGDKRVRGLTLGAYRALVDYQWPGNTRELDNEVRRMVALCPDGGVIDESLLSPVLRESADTCAAEATANRPAPSRLEDQVARLEARMIRDAMEETGGNRSRAASLLGLSRNGLAMKISRLGIHDGAAARSRAPEGLPSRGIDSARKSELPTSPADRGRSWQSG